MTARAVIALVLAGTCLAGCSPTPAADPPPAAGAPAAQRPEPSGLLEHPERREHAPVETAAPPTLDLPPGWARTDAGPDGLPPGGMPDFVVLLGLDTTAVASGAFVPSVSAVLDASLSGGLHLEEAADAQARGLEAAVTVHDRRVLELGGRRTVRLTYGATGFDGVAYVVMARGATYVLTFAFAELTAERLALADRSAATFRS